MTTVLGQIMNADSPLRRLYAPVAEEMEQAEKILREEMRSEHAYVDELVRYGILMGGKRLRPALVLLTAKAVGKVSPEHLVVAAVVEMIHTATLVHDDVLDDAQIRRHLATVNCRWDNKASVLLGDYLFTHAFYLASTLGSTLACRLIGSATNTVCEGEMRQKGSVGDFTLTEEEYLDIISAKTAELCACSCELGAHYAGGSLEMVARMRRFGRNLGIAFQIVDDILDVSGDETTAGKSLGTDLAQQKPTLPIIRLLRLATPADRDEVVGILHGNAADRLAGLSPHLERYEAISYAREMAREYSRQALCQLEELPPSPSRDTMAAMAEYVVVRSH